MLDLYSLNDHLSSWLADEGITLTDDQLNDLTHVAADRIAFHSPDTPLGDVHD